MRTERIRTATLALLTAGALVTGCSADPPDRLSAVADRGAEVMPFDLDRTTHEFAKRDTGGVQSVTADTPGDTRQLELIRAHLRREAKAFSDGDFGDPARIHGDRMPGLAALRAGHERIEPRYRELPDGAQITYSTTDGALVRALHQWFDAQVSDHGPHAEHSG